MRKIIFRTILLTVFIVLFSSVGIASGAFYHYYQNEKCNDVQNAMPYMKEGYEQEGLKYLSKMQGRERITLIGKDGKVLYDSTISKNLENHRERKEYKDAMEHGTGESIRYSGSTGKKTYNYAVKLKDGNVLRLSIEYSSFFQVMKQALHPGIIVLLFSGVLAVFLALLASKKIMRPVNQVDLDDPKEVDHYIELTPLWSRLQQQNDKIEDQMKELRKKQQEFTTLTENMQEGLLMLNSRKEVVSYNSAVICFFGAGIVKRVGGHLYIREDSPVYEQMERAYTGQRSEEILTVGRKKYQMIATPIKRENGIRGAVILTFDVTEKAERDRLRQEFAANVSHELKTPLTSISGFAEIIRDGIVKEEDIQHFANRIYVESQRMISLVTDIINLSNLEEKKQYAQTEKIDLFSLAEQVLERLDGSAKLRGISTELDGEHVCMYGNYRIMEEVLQNLCDNAIKYNIENGTVRVHIGMNDGNILLTVSDTGIGIAKDEWERVFERFYRVDKSHSKEVGGTGLGLSIVKHGVMLHNGEITVESQLGQGTKIGVMLPVNEPNGKEEENDK